MKVYLDNNATTPVDPRVAEKAVSFLKKDSFGNPSSFHAYGRHARRAVEHAREQVARCLSVPPEAVLFTGSGSEGDNHAIKGAYFSRKARGNHIITTAVEHPAVLGTCDWLEKTRGAEVTYLPVDGMGRLRPEQVAEAITDRTTVVTVMAANNESGVTFPIREIARICRERDILFHTDAVQGLGKIPLDMEELGVDLLSIAGHKVYAPKGVGALCIRPGVKIDSLLHGGHQEFGLRAGTENVLGIVALGEACEIITHDLDEEIRRVTGLRMKLENGLFERIPHLVRNGDPDHSVSNTSNITVKYIEGEALLLALDMVHIAVSSGSACSTGSEDPSHVLRAMGIPNELARASLRISLGRFTTEAEIDYVLEQLPPIVSKLRAMSPIYPGDA